MQIPGISHSGAGVRVSFADSIVVLIVGIGIFVSLLFARIDSYIYSDARGTLLTAQAFLQKGSFELSPFESVLTDYSWQIYRTPSGIYYAYPLGTSLIHLPAVWLANEFGYDMSRSADEKALHLFCAALSVLFLFLLTYILSRRFTGHWTSLFFASILTMGTSFYSSCGMALWNVNYAAIVALLVINILANKHLMHRPDSGWLLGVLLFVGFTVRPSFALFIIIIFIYLIVTDTKQMFRAAFISGCMLGLYIMFSITNFGQALPGRYQITDFSQWQNIGKNLLGHLVSPSRGLFVYSPLFLISVFGGLVKGRVILKDRLALFLSAWFLIQLILLSSWYMWWGGGSFGYRLLTDILPAPVYVSLLVWADMWQSPERYCHYAVRYILPVLAAFSIWIHVIQGVNNPATLGWLWHPNKDQHPEFFWNYEFPQFLATEEQLMRMDTRFQEQQLNELGRLIEKIKPTNAQLVFHGWGPVEGSNEEEFRWTIGKQASIRIPVSLIGETSCAKEDCNIRIALWGATYLGQSIEIYINGKLAGTIESDKQASPNLHIYSTEPIKLDPRVTTVELKLYIKEPKAPADYEIGSSGDHRELGFSLREIRVYLVEGKT